MKLKNIIYNSMECFKKISTICARPFAEKHKTLLEEIKNIQYTNILRETKWSWIGRLSVAKMSVLLKLIHRLLFCNGNWQADSKTYVAMQIT